MIIIFLLKRDVYVEFVEIINFGQNFVNNPWKLSSDPSLPSLSPIPILVSLKMSSLILVLYAAHFATNT